MINMHSKLDDIDTNFSSSLATNCVHALASLTHTFLSSYTPQTFADIDYVTVPKWSSNYFCVIHRCAFLELQ